MKRFTSLILAFLIFSSSFCFALLQNPDTVTTRGFAEIAIKAGLSAQNTPILIGDANGNLNLDKPIRRIEIFIMLYRAIPNINNLNTNITFKDVPSWAKNEISSLAAVGIVKGYSDGRVGANDNIRIRDLCTLIERAKKLRNIKPSDDFYQAVNAKWMSENKLQSGQYSIDAFTEAGWETSFRISSIISNCQSGSQRTIMGSDQQKIADLYESVLDWESRNKTGLDAITNYLEAINKSTTIDELLSADAKIVNETGVSTILAYSISNENNDIVLYVYGSRTLQSKETMEVQKNRNYLESYISRLFSEASLANANTDATLAVETSYLLTQSEPYASDFFDEQQILSDNELESTFKHTDINKYFNEIGFNFHNSVATVGNYALKFTGEYFNNDNLNALKALAKANMLSTYAKYLNKNAFNADSAYQNGINGASGQYDDESYAMQATLENLSIPIEKMYIDKYFTTKEKSDVTDMIKNIISEYQEQVGNNKWMADSTKAEAVKKLSKMAIRVGYPDKWYDPTKDCKITSVKQGGSLVQNVISVGKASFLYEIELAKSGGRGNNLQMPVYEVNAYYSSSDNSINFPVGILLKPIYSVDAKPEEKYAKIGTVIAHEISHAFDNNGAKLDENGNEHDWWTTEDYETYSNKSDALTAIFDNYIIEYNAVVNGKMVISEVIADLGAISCTLGIVKKLPNADLNLFFQSYAKLWRGVETIEYVEYLCKNDSHPPRKARVNKILCNFQEFYDTYNITDENGMYISPEDRVTLW